MFLQYALGDHRSPYAKPPTLALRQRWLAGTSMEPASAGRLTERFQAFPKLRNQLPTLPALLPYETKSCYDCSLKEKFALSHLPKAHNGPALAGWQTVERMHRSSQFDRHRE